MSILAAELAAAVATTDRVDTSGWTLAAAALDDNCAALWWTGSDTAMVHPGGSFALILAGLCFACCERGRCAVHGHIGDWNEGRGERDGLRHCPNTLPDMPGVVCNRSELCGPDCLITRWKDYDGD